MDDYRQNLDIYRQIYEQNRRNTRKSRVNRFERHDVKLRLELGGTSGNALLTSHDNSLKSRFTDSAKPDEEKLSSKFKFRYKIHR